MAPAPDPSDAEYGAPEAVAVPGEVEVAPASDRAAQAQTAILEASEYARSETNALAARVFVTLGGRVGSGLGLLLEGLWGFYVNVPLREQGFQMAWRADHDYNDFACVDSLADWDPADRDTELLRVEAKSMSLDADEPKGHFDELVEAIGPRDLLLVLVWRWTGDRLVWPEVHDVFVGSARRVAALRDALHLERGGSFVNRSSCPDGCAAAVCTHHGEPLNASGVRERAAGPEACVTGSVQFAANFGGLIRMLGARSPEAKSVLREFRRNDNVAHEYISFIHRNRPDKEKAAYTVAELRRAVDELLGVDASGLSADDCLLVLRERTGSDYMGWLRDNL